MDGGPTGVEVAAEMHDMIFDDGARRFLVLFYGVLYCYLWMAAPTGGGCRDA